MPVNYFNNIVFMEPYASTAGTYIYSTANTAYIKGGSGIYGNTAVKPVETKPPEPKDDEDIPALWEQI